MSVQLTGQTFVMNASAKDHLPPYPPLLVPVAALERVSRLSLVDQLSVLTSRRQVQYEPVTETVPEVPPRYPVFFVDGRRVSAQIVKVPCLRASSIGERQDLPMLCGLRNLIPFVWRPSGWEQS
jgi:hypothetical protein